MIKTLEGVRVIALTLAAAGPTCSKLLAEYGADVCLVEPLKGMNTRGTVTHDWNNANKKSVAINLKTEEGKEFFLRMLERADVLVTNYRTKALKKMGLDYDALKERFPRLIYASITGYGEAGPMKDDPGFDVTGFWGYSGLEHDMMERDAPPIVPPSGVGDCIVGQTLALGVCAALFYRERSGEGVKVYTSLLAEGIYANHNQILHAQRGVVYPKTRLKPNRSLMNSYPCKDGYLNLITLNFDKDFWNLLRVLGREDLVGDPRWTCMKDTEGEKAEEIRIILDECFRKLTVEEAMEKLQSIDMACGRIVSGLSTLSDPQVEANRYLIDYVDERGKAFKVAASPIKFGDDEPGEFRMCQKVGENTVAALQECGYTQEEIDDMIARKIVTAC